MKAQVIQELKVAGDALRNAWSWGVKGNPLAAEIPAFQRMKELEKELGQIMLAVTKLRGME